MTTTVSPKGECGLVLPYRLRLACRMKLRVGAFSRHTWHVASRACALDASLYPQHRAKIWRCLSGFMLMIQDTGRAAPKANQDKDSADAAERYRTPCLSVAPLEHFEVSPSRCGSVKPQETILAEDPRDLPFDLLLPRAKSSDTHTRGHNQRSDLSDGSHYCSDKN